MATKVPMATKIPTAIKVPIATKVPMALFFSVFIKQNNLMALLYYPAIVEKNKKKSL